MLLLPLSCKLYMICESRDGNHKRVQPTARNYLAVDLGNSQAAITPTPTPRCCESMFRNRLNGKIPSGLPTTMKPERNKRSDVGTNALSILCKPRYEYQAGT